MIRHGDPKTVTKFEELKALYQELTKQFTDSKNIIEVIKGIEEWEDKKHGVITTHRRNHWFKFPTATETMFSELRRQFERIRKNEEPSAEYTQS